MSQKSNLKDRPAKDQRNSVTQDDLIAYFCAEYGIDDTLPLYSGGLGILAGDHCKTASDMRLPFVAVGLFYHQGYLTQLLDAEGNQIARPNVTDPRYLPMNPVVDETGAEIHVEVKIGDTPVLVKAWKVQVGTINLYLLDTNIPENDEENRAITDQLYGGNKHTRIKQEIVLGIGGVRILRKLGLTPTVWHMNEGHSAFLILERIRELRAKGLSPEAALEAIKVNTVFTTHTPVPAGHDHFSIKLMKKYLNFFYHHELCLDENDLMALGHFPNEPSDFNMTVLAIRGSHYLNGVSRLHGQIASSMFAAFWPKVELAQNPVDYVTNGVHVPSFLAREWRDLFDETLGAEWRNQLCDAEFWKKGIEKIPDKTFWETKQGIKSHMLAAIRDRLNLQNGHNGIRKTDSEQQFKFVANPNKNLNVLTIGFARRFTTYKRATLLLNNLEMLQSLISDDLPIMFIFSGKAHPADKDAQKLIKRLYQTALEPEFRGHILVLEEYDLALSRHLVAGADVWLNNPVYRQEASGTSGMKVAINGGLNLSILDGWWPEGYDGENGWAIEPSPHGDNEVLRDCEDAQSLYQVLSDEVIPLYYSKGKDNYSPDWIKKAKRAIATILPRFNSERMVNEYLEKFYAPASCGIMTLGLEN